MVDMQPYIIVEHRKQLFICCMHCGKMKKTISTCDHKVRSGDYFLDVKEVSIKLKGD